MAAGRASRIGMFAALVCALAPAPVLAADPLPRFEGPVCPGVVGMQVEMAEGVVGRIRENAEGLGLRLADPAVCEPNILVVFLEDGQDYLNRLAADKPYLFESLSTRDRRDLLARSGPVRAFLTTATRSRDGLPVSRRNNLVDIPQAGMWSAHSRIYTPTRRDITSAMVLFDRQSVSGLNTGQLADYATMVALVHRPPDAGDADGGSILSLFEEGARPAAGLTAFDRAYLGTLYEGIPNLPAERGRARLSRATGDLSQ